MLQLHHRRCRPARRSSTPCPRRSVRVVWARSSTRIERHGRSEEHTSELQSHSDLVCRLLLGKQNAYVEIPHTESEGKTEYDLEADECILQVAHRPDQREH